MLHGEVKVNGNVIGEWKAVRQTMDANQFNNYNCFIRFQDMQGYTNEARWELIGHGFGNGAISLAARVLREGMTKAKRIESALD